MYLSRPDPPHPFDVARAPGRSQCGSARERWSCRRDGPEPPSRGAGGHRGAKGAEEREQNRAYGEFAHGDLYCRGAAVSLKG